MSKEWKRVIAILAFVAGCMTIALTIGLFETKKSAGSDQSAKTNNDRMDSTAMARDSVLRAENDRRMREYMRQHPEAVRDKYRP